MGSWDNTCALTNLPIGYGDEVYVFPVKEVDPDGYRSRCYSTALYSPSLIPFRAVYDDYGRGDREQGIALNLTLSALKEDLVEMEIGENQYHDIAVKRDEFGIDLFYEAIHEDRLFVNGWGKTPRPVYFAMVQKSIVDRLWNEWHFEFYGSPGAVGLEIDRTITAEYVVYKTSYANISKLIPGFIDSINDEDTLRRLEFFSSLRTVSDHPLSKFFDESHRTWDLIRFKQTLVDYIRDGKRTEAEELIRDYLVGYMVDSMMEHTRRVWLPVMFQGSQSQCYEEYQLLGKITDEFIAEEFKKYEEYEE